MLNWTDPFLIYITNRMNIKNNPHLDFARLKWKSLALDNSENIPKDELSIVILSALSKSNS